MIKLNFDDYDSSYAVCCASEEEAKEFCDYLYANQFRWESGLDLSKITYWNKGISEKIFYHCFEGRRAVWYKVEAGSYNTIYFSDLKNEEYKKEEFDLGFDDMWG